ncbi:MAG: hypothetical protein KAG84_00405 [Bacteroidales bacterium]|nr:hypothetical protein [Bacteroidales bacterium]
MTNKHTIVWGLIRKAISTIDIKVYSISLIIASLIWFIMTMSDNYTERVEFPVSYSNFPKGLVLVNNPSKNISVDIEAKGFELASVALSENKSVNIDLKDIEFRKTKFGRFVASIATKSFRYNIVNQLNVDDVGKDFIPDSIYFVFDSIVTKNIPVHFDANIAYSEGYVSYGDPIITPSIVTVTGPSSEVNSLSYVSTRNIELENLKENYSNDLLLKAQKYLKYSISKVHVNQRVAKYSEFTITKKVNLLTNIPDLKAKLFPKSIDIIFSMPLPDYKLFVDTSFNLSVRIDSLDMLHKKKLLVNLSHIPEGADNIRLSAESVEYIIID